MKRTIIIFGLLLGAFLVLLGTLRYSIFFSSMDESLYTGIIAAVFLATGIWAGMSFFKRKEPVFKEETFPEGRNKLLTERENEVLRLIEMGFTNRQISEKLFISVNTTKTHISNIYSKLNVSNRTQAVSTIKNLNNRG